MLRNPPKSSSDSIDPDPLMSFLPYIKKLIDVKKNGITILIPSVRLK